MAESWEGKDGYAPKSHGHDQYITRDDINTLKQQLLGNIMDWLPIGTVLWFKQNVTLSNKWTVCTELVGRYPLGAIDGLGDTVEAGLPNIEGTFFTVHKSDHAPTGAFAATSTNVNGMDYQSTPTTTGDMSFDASLSNEIYGKSDTVTPPSMKLIPYIKIA